MKKEIKRDRKIYQEKERMKMKDRMNINKQCKKKKSS